MYMPPGSRSVLQLHSFVSSLFHLSLLAHSISLIQSNNCHAAESHPVPVSLFSALVVDCRAILRLHRSSEKRYVAGSSLLHAPFSVFRGHIACFSFVVLAHPTFTSLHLSGLRPPADLLHTSTLVPSPTPPVDPVSADCNFSCHTIFLVRAYVFLYILHRAQFRPLEHIDKLVNCGQAPSRDPTASKALTRPRTSPPDRLGAHLLGQLNA